MSGRGIDFLVDWVQRNVTDDDRNGDRLRAAELAERCKNEATVYGVTIDDMEPEWGSVETIIYEAMQNDKEAELEFWKAFAATPERNVTRH